MRRTSLLMLLSCMIAILVGCTSVDYKSYEPKQFQYGKIVQTEAEVNDRLKIMDDKIYLVSSEYSLDDSKGQIEFREVNNSLKLSKSQLLELTNIETSTISLSSFSDNSNPSGAISIFNPSKEIGIVAGPQKYIPTSQRIKKEKGDYIGVGTFSNGDNAILFLNSNGEYTVTCWDELSKLKNEALLTNITKEKNMSVESMAVFRDKIYIYSSINSKVYEISQDLKLLHSWIVEGDFKNEPTKSGEASSQFVIQRELNELFLFNSQKPDQGFYMVSDKGLDKFKFGQEKYKAKYILANNCFYNLYNNQVILSDDEDVFQKVLDDQGNYYFMSTKDFSNPKKDTDGKTIYLTKINKKSLPAFIKELNEKNK